MMELRSNRAVAALAALVLMAAATASATAADFPKGTITAVHGSDEWSIRFEGDGTYVVARNDEKMVEGKYKVAEDRIEFADEKARPTDPGARAGKYTWKLDGKKLTFKLVDDEAKGRMTALTSGPWSVKE